MSAVSRVFLLMLLAIPTLPAFADPTSESLTACAASRLQTAAGYRMGFEQAQHLAALNAPLMSRGDVDLQASGSIRWHVREPIDYELFIDVNGAVTASDGTSFDHPAIMRLVRMLLTMDTLALSSTFLIQGTCDDTGWSLHLTPTDETLKGLFSRINAAGHHLLSDVELVAHSGDRTVFTFTDLAKPSSTHPSNTHPSNTNRD